MTVTIQPMIWDRPEPAKRLVLGLSHRTTGRLDRGSTR